MTLQKKATRKFAFNKRSIEILPPHDKVRKKGNGTEYSDSVCTGLHLIVGPTGRKHFIHRFTAPNGKKGSIALGEYLPSAVSIEDVRKMVYAQKAKLALGEDPREERQQKQQVPTFADFAREHYLPHAKQHKKTWQEDVWKIDRALIPAFGDQRLDAVTTREITVFHNGEKERTSAITANHMLRLLTRMFNLAVNWGFVEKSPRMPEKFKEKTRERYLSKDELKRFLMALDLVEDTGAVSAIRLLLHTGCRRNEILSLEVKNVHLEESLISLPADVTKTKKARTVLLSAPARAVLEQQLQRAGDSRWVFPGKDDTHLKDIRKPFDRVLKLAEIEELRIHDLRHTFATYAAARSGIHHVSKLLGHADTSMTARYAHHIDADLRKAVDAAADEMERAVA